MRRAWRRIRRALFGVRSTSRTWAEMVGAGFLDGRGRPTLEGAFYVLRDIPAHGLYGVIVSGPLADAPTVAELAAPRLWWRP